MQAAGLSDQVILDSSSRSKGKRLLRSTRASWDRFPCTRRRSSDLILVVWLIRKYQPQPPSAEAPCRCTMRSLNRYHEQIEKEVEKLD